MQKFLLISILIISITFTNFSCRLNKESQNIAITKPALITFQDSVIASKSIISDDVDGLYDQVSKLEMEIQMKRKAPFADRAEAIKAYQKFIVTEVSSWTVDEKESLLDIFNKVKKMCDTLSPRIFPGGLQLIKVKTNHYGNHVYYTRGRNILIPENIFPIEDAGTQLSVMLHEVFHILSRYNPDIRHDLYRMIGFEKSEKPVKLNSVLSTKLLTNPDGVSYQYVMKLDSIVAVPLITSKFPAFRSTSPMFFDYLNFDLYKTIDMGTYLEATTDPNGNTTIPLNKTPIFFTKIKDNTQYIIHPDEIIADNFMLAVQAHYNNDYSKFSKEGKTLIELVLERLRKI